MAEPLWTLQEVLDATGGRLEAPDAVAIGGVTFDSREAGPGDLFVALQGVRDGHDFVGQAFAQGAAAALVSRPVEGGPFVVVPDTLKGLEALGLAARKRATNARRGAVVNIVSASWGSGPGKAEQWQLLARARAVDTTTFVLACGQGDPATQGVETKGTAPTGVGYSAVVSPFGQVLESLEGEPGLIFADLDATVVQEARQKLPVLANRRDF